MISSSTKRGGPGCCKRLIYSVGLFDYFGLKTGQRLVARMFDLLAPGGVLIVGNMRRGSDLVWPLEFIADWTLNYRTADEIARFADGIEPAYMDIRTDPGSHFILLTFRR